MGGGGGPLGKSNIFSLFLEGGGGENITFSQRSPPPPPHTHTFFFFFFFLGGGGGGVLTSEGVVTVHMHSLLEHILMITT